MFPVPVLNEGSTPPSPLKMRKLFLACKEIDKIGNAENQVHLRFITRLLGILSLLIHTIIYLHNLYQNLDLNFGG